MESPIKKLLATVKSKADITIEEELEISRYVVLKNVKKNEIFLEAGTICTKVFFVVKGLLRSFHVNPNGSEFTRLFIQEDQFCTVLISFNDHIKSPASFQALEDSMIIEISEKDFKLLLSKFDAIKQAYLKILEDYQNFQISRLEFLTQNSAKEKVNIFHRENPQIASRISKKIIATYLQITPETYSRYTNDVN